MVQPSSDQTPNQAQQGQPAPQQASHQHTEREREVIVTDGSSGGAGTVIAAVAGVLVILFVGWLLVTNIGGGSGESPVEVPSEVNIDVNNEGGGSGG